MKITKITSAEKTVIIDGKKEKKHYGYWVCIRTPYGASDRFIVSENIHLNLYRKIHSKEIKVGTNIVELLNELLSN